MGSLSPFQNARFHSSKKTATPAFCPPRIFSLPPPELLTKTAQASTKWKQLANFQKRPRENLWIRIWIRKFGKSQKFQNGILEIATGSPQKHSGQATVVFKISKKKAAAENCGFRDFSLKAHLTSSDSVLSTRNGCRQDHHQAFWARHH